MKKTLIVLAVAVVAGVCSDEICKTRAGQWKYLHIIRPLALDAFRMAQEVVSGQGFLESGIGGSYHQGEIVQPGAE